MLPIFALDRRRVCLKPILQVIFEQLYDGGIREFCFIVGRGKESIYDHFTCDENFLYALKKEKKNGLAKELRTFYEKIGLSSIVFINQPSASGFGDAVLTARPYINEPFLVQAGDTIIFSKKNRYVSRLENIQKQFNAAATFLVQEVVNPKPYGVIKGQEIKRGIYDVEMVVKKPKKPPTNLAITAVYLFNPTIFEALKSTPKGYRKELQLTDGIQILIESGFKVMALQLDADEPWFDIGNPQSYHDVLQKSYFYAKKSRTEEALLEKEENTEVEYEKAI